jgi:subtilase family serine protease
MRMPRASAAVTVAAVSLAAVASFAASSPSPTARSTATSSVAPAAPSVTKPPAGPVEPAAERTPHPSRDVCGPARPGVAECSAKILQDGSSVSPDTAGSPTGLSPTQIGQAYGLSVTTGSGSGQTIAVVDAYDDPTAAADLQTFSGEYGLPCNSCLTKVNQAGVANNPPAANADWSLEISLDLDWAHAIAPGAHILLVEANSNGINDLMSAESYAGSHARYVSNSWGSSEFGGETTLDSGFGQSAVSYFVAAGDDGLGAQWPSSSPDVVSVGGTTLNFGSGGGFTGESAWSDGGGGCSAQEPAAPGQAQDAKAAGCGTRRATPDIALDADPNSGVSVYDSTTYEGQSGWWTVGGTSAATPMIAALSADTGSQITTASVYAGTMTIRDVTTGDNGAAAGFGYDLATGVGTWADDAESQSPAAPLQVTARPSASGVTVAWNAPRDVYTVDSFAVYRSSGGATPIAIAPSVAGYSYLDATAASGITYTYQVYSVNKAGSSAAGSATATPSGGGASSLQASFTKSCSGATCTFTSTSTVTGSTITHYTWSGSVTGTSSSVSRTYARPATFKVNLVVRDAAGKSSKAAGTVTCTGTRKALSCS